MATKKAWMVEQWWKVAEGTIVPVRSVVEATTRKRAQEGAAEACRKAVAQICGGEARGEPDGGATVLYAIG